MVKGEIVHRPSESDKGISYKVRPVRDPEHLRSRLMEQPLYAAYAIGCLEPRLFPTSEWWLAEAEGANDSALLSHCRSTLGSSLFAMGDADALDAAVALHPGARSTFATFQVDHLPVMERHFMVQNRRTMQRMVVTKETFRPVDGVAERLRGSDIALINRLYNTQGSYYTGRHIDESVYYGVTEGGRLVSIAGTHIVAPSEKVAVVGNVYTLPRYRGRGYATLATSAVTAELLESCTLVALTVDPQNTPAVRAYERLGYQPKGFLMESMAYRKDLLGVTSFVRRVLARKDLAEEE